MARTKHGSVYAFGSRKKKGKARGIGGGRPKKMTNISDQNTDENNDNIRDPNEQQVIMAKILNENYNNSIENHKKYLLLCLM